MTAVPILGLGIGFINFTVVLGVFIVTFIRVFAEFFQVVVVIPRWDHRLKDPESVAFAIL